jgi:hypothetical protein
VARVLQLNPGAPAKAALLTSLIRSFGVAEQPRSVAHTCRPGRRIVRCVAGRSGLALDDRAGPGLFFCPTDVLDGSLLGLAIVGVFMLLAYAFLQFKDCR